MNPLRALLASPRPETLLEVHDALSAVIAAEAGAAGLWASSLTLSASWGVWDHSVLSMDRALDVLESITDRVATPVLFDGDTGYGSAVHFQRLVKKLGQRGVAGVCIEDKVFPKSNSFLRSEQQALAPVEEMCGKIAAGADARDRDVVIVARTEALVTGVGLEVALARAHAYVDAGADAVLVHTKAPTFAEIAAFMGRWDGRAPVACVPTTCFGTDPAAFAEHGVSLVIWANHLLRASIRAQKEAAAAIVAAGSARGIEDDVASVAEIFRLQRCDDLERAEARYERRPAPGAVVLAASRGEALDPLTDGRPKCLAPVHGRPLLEHVLARIRGEGIRRIGVVRGYGAEHVAPEGAALFDNPDWARTGELTSLARAREALVGDVLVAYGDVLFQRWILRELLGSSAPLTIAVDASRRFEALARPTDRVRASRPPRRGWDEHRARLERLDPALPAADAHGEWIGLLLARGEGTEILRAALDATLAEPGGERLGVGELLDRLAPRVEVRIVYVSGGFVDVDELSDLAELL